MNVVLHRISQDTSVTWTWFTGGSQQ